MQEFAKSRSRVQVLIFISKRRAQQQGRWTNIDPSQRRPMFRRNVVENRPQSSPDLVPWPTS